MTTSLELKVPSDVEKVVERLLEAGNVVQKGSGKELLNSPDVQRAYLGCDQLGAVRSRRANRAASRNCVGTSDR